MIIPSSNGSLLVTPEIIGGKLSDKPLSKNEKLVFGALIVFIVLFTLFAVSVIWLGVTLL